LTNSSDGGYKDIYIGCMPEIGKIAGQEKLR
jgi:hypothetical protein